MLRFLSLGYKVKDPETLEPKKRVGRPPRVVPEGALELGEKRVRVCASRAQVSEKLKMESLERQLKSLQAMVSQDDTEDKRLAKVMQMVEEASTHAHMRACMHTMHTMHAMHAMHAMHTMHTLHTKSNGNQ